MNSVAIVIIIVLVVGIFIRNHFKEDEVTPKLYSAFFIFLSISIYFSIRMAKIDSGVIEGFLLRFILGILIGVLQGSLVNLYLKSEKIMCKGTAVGAAFWLILIPVRLLILPWFSQIAQSGVNLGDFAHLGVSAAYVFTGLAISKSTTIILRKKFTNKFTNNNILEEPDITLEEA